MTRVALDKARTREYAADAAIEWDIGQVRSYMTSTTRDRCPVRAERTRVPPTALNGDPDPGRSAYKRSGIHALRVRAAQRDVHGLSSASGQRACPASTVIIKAQVNFASQKKPPVDATIIVDKTYIQTWSVES